jgi:hypothetical protein
MKTLLFIFLFLFSASLFAQTEGTLTVSTSTSTAGGNFAPKNIVAIWIEDAQGNFVKTLLAYAQTRKTHLNTWEASTTAAGSPYNTVDAITGATRTSHAQRTCTWNGRDVNGNVVPDGTYKVRMELTDKNGTGNFSSFQFNKSTNPENITPASVPSFSSITITWEPLITSVEDYSMENNIRIFPNPSTGIFNIESKWVIEEVQVLDAGGAFIGRAASSSVDLGDQPDGIYYLRITMGKQTIAKKIIKKS